MRSLRFLLWKRHITDGLRRISRNHHDAYTSFSLVQIFLLVFFYEVFQARALLPSPHAFLAVNGKPGLSGLSYGMNHSGFRCCAGHVCPSATEIPPKNSGNWKSGIDFALRVSRDSAQDGI